MTLALILLFSLLGSVCAVLVTGVLFQVRREFSPRLKTAVLSYATGSLLGAAFLGMIPHALAELPAPRVLGTVLAGIGTIVRESAQAGGRNEKTLAKYLN